MLNRQTHKADELGLGRVRCAFQFKTNNASDVTLTTVKGVTASSTAIGSNQLPFVKSITHAAAGKLLVTLNDSVNLVVSADAELDDSVDDGAYATVGNISNEGTATACTFNIFTRAAGGVKTDYVNRKVYVDMVVRNTVAETP